jgi:hypothetical protein
MNIFRMSLIALLAVPGAYAQTGGGTTGGSTSGTGATGTNATGTGANATGTQPAAPASPSQAVPSPAMPPFPATSLPQPSGGVAPNTLNPSAVTPNAGLGATGSTLRTVPDTFAAPDFANSANLTGATAADRRTALSVKNAIIASQPALPGVGNSAAPAIAVDNLQIFTANGRTTIRGTVRSEQDKAAVIERAVRVVGPNAVDNELIVAPFRAQQAVP